MRTFAAGFGAFLAGFDKNKGVIYTDVQPADDCYFLHFLTSSPLLWLRVWGLEFETLNLNTALVKAKSLMVHVIWVLEDKKGGL